MALLLQPRQTRFDLRPMDVAERHRTMAREDVFFELIAVDAQLSLISEDDRLAVSRMFRLVFDAVKEVAPGFQVVVTEHADINDDWYQAAVVERWRGGLKLVPEDWPTKQQ